MSRLTLLLVLSLGACTDRALGIGGIDSISSGGPHDGGGPNRDGGDPQQPKPPGDLPQEYCERIVTLSDTGELALFDPSAKVFSGSAQLDCPAGGGAGPYSIAIDDHGQLWVVYSNGKLFHADVQTGDCEDSGYMPDQAGFHAFDMTFAVDPDTGRQMLFASSVADFGKVKLGKIDPQTLGISTVGPMTANAELTSTIAGEVWGMFRGTNPHAARINLSTIALAPDLKVPLGDITGDGLAFSSFSGAFYVFLLPHNSSTSVYRMSATDGTLDQLLEKTGRRIISATIPICR